MIASQVKAFGMINAPNIMTPHMLMFRELFYNNLVTLEWVYVKSYKNTVWKHNDAFISIAVFRFFKITFLQLSNRGNANVRRFLFGDVRVVGWHTNEAD